MEPWLGRGEALSLHRSSHGIPIICRLQQPHPFPGSPWLPSAVPDCSVSGPGALAGLSTFSDAALGKEQAAGPLPGGPQSGLPAQPTGPAEAIRLLVGLLCLSVRHHSLWGGPAVLHCGGADKSVAQLARQPCAAFR